VASHKLEDRATQTPVSSHSVEDKIEEKRYRWLQTRLEKQKQKQEREQKSYLKLVKERLESFLQLRKEGYEKFPPWYEFKEEWFFQRRKEEHKSHYAQRMLFYDSIVKQSRRDGTLTVKFLHSLFVFSF